MNKEHNSDLTIPYVKVGDYYFPNFALPPDAGDIGFWGRKRREFLREHRPVTFNQLVLSGELFKYGNQRNHALHCHSGWFFRCKLPRQEEVQRETQRQRNETL